MHFVYFIGERWGASVKIGLTCNSPRSRLLALQTGNPSELRMLGLVQFDDSGTARGVERDLHEMLSSKRVRGEWFSVSREEVAVCFERLKPRLSERKEFLGGLRKAAA